MVKHLLKRVIGDQRKTHIWNTKLEIQTWPAYASVFRMDSRLCNLLHWSFRDLPQTVFVIAERFASQEEGRLTKRNTTLKNTQMIQQNKVLDYKPQKDQCICLGITRVAQKSNASILRMFTEREDWVTLALAFWQGPVTTPHTPHSLVASWTSIISFWHIWLFVY